jgi:hypothetical protein
VPVILNFGGDTGDESVHRGASSLLPPQPISSPSPFDNCSPLRSFEGLVTADLLDNFLNILKLFMGVESDFTKSL